MNRGHTIAEGVMNSSTLLKRFIPGFTDENHTRQAPGLPNHVAWNLGHLALTMHRVADKIDGKGIPAADFIEGTDKGDAQRFGTESVSFKSVPTDDKARYPGMARCVAIFDAACERLAAGFRNADEATLEKTAPWGAVQVPLWGLGLRMAFHNGVHCGQITDIRRAIGLPGVLG